MNKKVGIVGGIVVIIIIAVIIICIVGNNGSSKFNKQFLEYEGAVTEEDMYNLCALLIANAEENGEDSSKLPTLKENEEEYGYETWVEGGTVAKLDLSEYVSTLKEIQYLFDDFDDTDSCYIISFEYSSDTNLIESIVLGHIN